MKKFVLFVFLCLFMNAIFMVCLYFNPTDWIKIHVGFWISFIALDILLLSAVFSMIRKRWKWPPENQAAWCSKKQAAWHSPKIQKRRSMVLTGSFFVYCGSILTVVLTLAHDTIISSIAISVAIYLISVALFILLISYLQTWIRQPGPPAHFMWAANLSKSNVLGLYLVISIVYGGIYGLLYHYITTGHYPFWLRVNSNYILVFVILAVIALYNWAYNRNRERKLAGALQVQEILNLKLRSIRAQLNPHFMFNALTSIQNLMNKNDIPAANHYLAMFADLTRRVLNTSEQELISLEDELKILEDYLQMEQLRFGFQYQIKVDNNINIANTEIPAMLLQPFVENAVKHGVATLNQNGTIKLQIKKHLNDLTLSLTDNGQGFDKDLIRQNTNSFGLKLSEERIALLNQVNKNQPVILNIDARQTGTHISIELKNLFL